MSDRYEERIRREVYNGRVNLWDRPDGGLILQRTLPRYGFRTETEQYAEDGTRPWPGADSGELLREEEQAELLLTFEEKMRRALETHRRVLRQLVPDSSGGQSGAGESVIDGIIGEAISYYVSGSLFVYSGCTVSEQAAVCRAMWDMAKEQDVLRSTAGRMLAMAFQNGIERLRYETRGMFAEEGRLRAEEILRSMEAEIDAYALEFTRRSARLQEQETEEEDDGPENSRKKRRKRKELEAGLLYGEKLRREQALEEERGRLLEEERKRREKREEQEEQERERREYDETETSELQEFLYTLLAGEETEEDSAPARLGKEVLGQLNLKPDIELAYINAMEDPEFMREFRENFIQAIRALAAEKMRELELEARGAQSGGEEKKPAPEEEQDREKSFKERYLDFTALCAMIQYSAAEALPLAAEICRGHGGTTAAEATLRCQRDRDRDKDRAWFEQWVEKDYDVKTDTEGYLVPLTNKQIRACMRAIEAAYFAGLRGSPEAEKLNELRDFLVQGVREFNDRAYEKVAKLLDDTNEKLRMLREPWNRVPEDERRAKLREELLEEKSLLDSIDCLEASGRETQTSPVYRKMVYALKKYAVMEVFSKIQIREAYKSCLQYAEEEKRERAHDPACLGHTLNVIRRIRKLHPGLVSGVEKEMQAQPVRRRRNAMKKWPGRMSARSGSIVLPGKEPQP